MAREVIMPHRDYSSFASSLASVGATGHGAEPVPPEGA